MDRRSRRMRSGSPDAGVFRASGIRRAPADSEAVHRRRLERRRSTRCAACCRRPRSRTSASTARARPSKRCCCACARIRSLEVRDCADQMLTELRKVIPAFLTRVDQADRGGRWSTYLADTWARPRPLRRTCRRTRRAADEVTLTDFDPDGEIKVVAAALYAVADLPDDQLLAIARRLSADERAACSAPTSASAANRRHKPGTRIRAHGVSVRRPDRLRRVPRPAATSPADDRVAAALDEAWLHRAGRHRRSRRAGRLDAGDGRSRHCTNRLLVRLG